MKLHPREQYLLTKLSVSVHDMAMSRDNFKEKIRAVFREHLEPAIRQELPDSEEKRDLFKLLLELTSVKVSNRGSISDSIDALSYHRAKQIAQSICDIETNLNSRANLT